MKREEIMLMRKCVPVRAAFLMCALAVANHLVAQEERPAGREGAQRDQAGRARQGMLASAEDLFKGEDTKLLGHTLLSDEYAYDDFPSIAVGSDGTAWVCYAAFTGMEDEIRVRKHADGRWDTFTRLPGVSGDVWMPKALVDGEGRFWVVWSQQEKGNWDVWARALEGNNWLKPHRITSAPGPDINAAAMIDGNERIIVAWQGSRNGQSDIFLKIMENGRWGDEITVCDDPANDWYPAVAADGNGTVYVAWDSYRNGNYDIFLRTYRDGKLGEEMAVTGEPNYQVNATLACDSEDRLWVVWEYGDANWAKDQGYTLRSGGKVGSAIYNVRDVKVAVLTNGSVMQPMGSVAATLPAAEQWMVHGPVLREGADGRMWMLFRHRRGGRGGQSKVFWLDYVTWYKGDGWAEAIPVPEGLGRLSGYGSLAAAPDGRLWVAWHTDNRVESNYHKAVHDDVYAGLMEALSASGEPKLEAYTALPEESLREGHGDEAGDVEAIRSYRTEVDGVKCGIVRGDLHRHTEFSWDNGGRTDGSVIEFYRYMMDGAAMDFGAVTDHNAGGDYLYWYWLTQKSSDLFHAPGGFVPLYGYERSAVYPWGHRNIFHSERGVPVVSFFTQADYTGPRPGVASGKLMDNDTELVYEQIERTGGIAISHTSGTNMGTDWAVQNRDDLEPVVEIFQGCRTSYEYVGAPKAATSQQNSPGGFKPDGFVWNAWERGYRLGVIASSDHVSTHISYAMVYTDDLSREGIMDAIRKRHTYGATDNIILDYRIGGRFMGDEFKTSEQPVLDVKIRGTDAVSKVDVVKNNTFLYSVEPGRQEVEFTYKDMQIEPGTSYYYVRVVQEDGQVAWSSPIWVNYEP